MPVCMLVVHFDYQIPSTIIGVTFHCTFGWVRQFFWYLVSYAWEQEEKEVILHMISYDKCSGRKS